MFREKEHEKMRKQIILTTVKEPTTFLDVPPVFLTEKTMEERKTS